jgi:hypothetical protein
MNTPTENSDSRWENLLRQARADVAPPVNVSALQRVVRDTAISPVENEGWAAEISALFPSTGMIPGCLAAALALAAVATWHAWDSWQALPWMQLLDASTGGGS